MYVDLGEYPVKELECMLSKKVDEARKAGISGEGSRRLLGLLKKYQPAFE